MTALPLDLNAEPDEGTWQRNEADDDAVCVSVVKQRLVVGRSEKKFYKSNECL